jgi:hypothetical protein
LSGFSGSPEKRAGWVAKAASSLTPRCTGECARSAVVHRSS